MNNRWHDKSVILEEIWNDSEYLNLYSIYLMLCPSKYRYHIICFQKGNSGERLILLAGILYLIKDIFAIPFRYNWKMWLLIRAYLHLLSHYWQIWCFLTTYTQPWLFPIIHMECEVQTTKRSCLKYFILKWYCCLKDIFKLLSSPQTLWGFFHTFTTYYFKSPFEVRKATHSWKDTV